MRSRKHRRGRQLRIYYIHNSVSSFPLAGWGRNRGLRSGVHISVSTRVGASAIVCVRRVGVAVAHLVVMGDDRAVPGVGVGAEPGGVAGGGGSMARGVSNFFKTQHERSNLRLTRGRAHSRVRSSSV